MSTQALPFSILERIDVGETIPVLAAAQMNRAPFSILERIDVGETRSQRRNPRPPCSFQYPRTDRRG